ncbi:hypothetical protein [Sphingomonas sp. M1-B02]|uniref:hypothetical protein n=1 Tax=Sphingomonas sp. M1-B02 TaxID=3114300 RepID=UPI00223F1364|nr:hypothetical protein [Sphingomonas sp. S6-11]UZK67324.1 hypothetical protein OKW87_05675 [Sphingomonas sp. S6-11]
MAKTRFSALMMTALLAGTATVATASAPLPQNKQQQQTTRQQDAEDAATDRDDIERFAKKAALQRDLGATQMNITEELPFAHFELDAEDPYPAWFAHHISLFKVFPSAVMAPFMDKTHSRRLQHLITERCRILAQNNLSAVWTANEPTVLPEAFFDAYPEYRGPRIDQANRSRKVFHSADVDNPDIKAMYRETVTSLLRICPQIDTFIWVTTDAGSGFAWSPALYPGANGPSEGERKPLADRVVGFMTNIQQAAAASGHTVRMNINQIEPRQWMIPTFQPDVQENIVRKLPAGLAVNGEEGPDGKPFETGVKRPANSPFYPVVGLAVPSFEPERPSNSTRRGFGLGERESVQFNYRFFKSTSGKPMADRLQRLAAIRAFAVSEVGEDQASGLVEAWQALDSVAERLDVLNFGGMLRFGHVLNRWIERPMVPFPLELSDAEKADYDPFLFQAKGPEQASNLADIQAMRMYEGWGARLLFQRTIETAMPDAEKALSILQKIAASRTDGDSRAYWDLSAKRVQALILLMRSADNMVAYQAQLDRVKALGITPEKDPVLGVQSDWARADMMNLARREIDFAIAMDKLLASTSAPILDLAPTVRGEYTMRLGPDLQQVLRRKVKTMNAHWRDYDRLFTVPNP